jgi:hypothetical protein
MNLILLAIGFTIVWFSIASIRTLISSITASRTFQANTQAFMWFFSLLALNLVIMAFIIGFYYYKIRGSPGALGPKGYQGSMGESSQPCVDSSGCPK